MMAGMGPIGAKLNAWHAEFAADAALQYRFGSVARFVNARLRDAYDASPELSATYPDFRDFQRNAKREASQHLLEVRDRSGREAARRKADEAGAKRTGVAEFTRRQLAKE